MHRPSRRLEGYGHHAAAAAHRRSRGRLRRTRTAAACSGGGGAASPSSIWYTNPDGGGQAAVAENCSTDDYTITTQVLPQDASQQRIQLARRLAAERPGHRPDEPGPAVHGRVRERRLPRADPAGHAGQLEGAVLQGRRRGGHVGRPARGGPVLVQHPGAVVPQVLRGEGRHRHDQAGHLGPDHQGRQRQRRHGRRCRPTSTRATRCGSTPSSPAPAATIVTDTDKGADATDRRRLRRRARTPPR